MLSINVTNLLKIYYNITGTEYKYFEAMLKGEFFYFNVEMWLIIKMGKLEPLLSLTSVTPTFHNAAE